MKKLKHKVLTLNGTKKRVGDIKATFQNIEYAMNFLHTSLISTNTCVTFLYPWGHIIIYTFPQDKIITVEFLYPKGNATIDKVVHTIIEIFQPETHTIKEINIW